jgi:hypothetical protein
MFPLSLYYIGRIFSQNQFEAVRNYGVYDVLSQQLISDDLCVGFSVDMGETNFADPTISQYTCFYGGRNYRSQGDCAVLPFDEFRRVCPCSYVGKGHKFMM